MKLSEQVLICLLASSFRPTISDIKEICTLGDEHYGVGDTWHPKLLPFGDNPCVNCTCLRGGEVMCNGMDCPKPKCEEPRIVVGQCCPTCEVQMEDENRSQVKEGPGCQFYGHLYEDGDVFPSNKTALKPKHSNQCVLCACYRGDVICHLKTCLPNHKCQKTMKVDDDCCLHCQDVTSLRGHTKLISHNQNQTLEAGDCLSATGRQKNGTRWKPVIGQYGEMKCIVCSCLNGHINCERLHCPKLSDLNCTSSGIPADECCNQCVTDVKYNDKELTETTDCSKGSRDRNNKKLCPRKKQSSRKSRTRNKNRTKHGRRIFLAEMQLNDVVSKLCLPEKSQHLVYHTRGNNLESLAFDWKSHNSLEYIQWTVRKGKIQNTERKTVLDPVEYRRNITVADILGAVQRKNIKTFFKQLDRRQRTV
ncbi:unnamed protein product [Candidula unifasciata]|uniref:VWFC domain-containing protein n=1 Tax=Candidula unifasciata TaxID=100452 RepID=A0A8S3ZCG2_9EUPU|nr:unnamed protein product [Candidula unifasciata]